MVKKTYLPLVIFLGPTGASEPESWVSDGCRANAHDLITRALQIPALRPICVVAPVDASATFSDLPIDLFLDPPAVSFHFGRRLREVIGDHNLERFLYLGGGAGPLLTVPALTAIVERACSLQRGVLTNNLYSTDFAAVSPAQAIDEIDPPATDNDLAWRLAAHGLPVEALPPSAATRLDLDTPHDLAIAALHPDCGTALRNYVHTLPLDTAPVRRILQEMHDPRGQLLVYGRLAAATWARLETLPCQTRAFSEERGMRASGRQERGQVSAWIGALYERLGAYEFFQSLGRVCTAALLDTRVLWAHLGWRLTAADRFYSDLLQPEQIVDPRLRTFTRAAQQAPVPLLLGGQALVSGDLWAMVEIG